jgi:hypothetical protein
VKLLWLLRYPPVPPANGGDAVYSRNLIESTAEIADVTALCYTSDQAALRNGPGLTWHQVPGTRKVKALSVFSPLPNITHRHRQAAYLKAMTSLAREADAVVVDHIGLFFAVKALRETLGASCPPIIVINHDHEGSLRTDMVRVVSNPLLRGVLYLDGLKANRIEKIANRMADGLTAITGGDQDSFASDAPHVPSLLLMPGYDGPVVERRTIDEDTPMRLCILGGRGAFHKQMVLRIILDKIVQAGLHRRVIVDVVGGTTRTVDERSRAYDGVNFLGYVNDLREYMGGARLGLIPDEVGGGFKLRALTHAFMRVPMLALSKALHGMPFRDGIDFAGVVSVDEMVAAIPSLMTDDARLNFLQENAFSLCEGGFAWRDRAADLVEFAAGLRLRRSHAEPKRRAG